VLLCSAFRLLHVGFLSGLLFHREDGGAMLPRNVGGHCNSEDRTLDTHRRENMKFNKSKEDNITGMSANAPLQTDIHSLCCVGVKLGLTPYDREGTACLGIGRWRHCFYRRDRKWQEDGGDTCIVWAPQFVLFARWTIGETWSTHGK
jgi:hypothetical protein